MSFKCGLFSLEGSEAILHETQAKLSNTRELGLKTAIHVIEKGGSELMEKIKSQMR